MIKEVSQVLPVLGALIVANIAAGTVNSMAVEKTNFVSDCTFIRI
jgi:hypothetical protein